MNSDKPLKIINFNQSLDNGYFFDWLAVTQLYIDRNLPKVCSIESTHTNKQTGEIWDTRQKLRHEGSFSTYLIIKCDGNRVTVSGNPSRYNRPDNLWGFSSLDDCIEVYNQVLEEFDLPPFSKTDDLIKKWNEKNKTWQYVNNGAEIQQVHVTKNFWIGENNEDPFIRGFGSFAYKKKLANVYANLKTVDWLAGSRHLYMKIYNKAFSLEKERKKLKKHYSEIELAYYDKIIKYCKEGGLVRLEYEYKSDYLNRREMRHYGLFDVNQLLKFRFLEECMENCNTTVQDMTSIANDLLTEGICKSMQSANSTQSIFYMWLNGQDLESNYSRAQIHVHKKRLIQLGYDITAKMNVSTLPLRIKRQEDIILRDADIIPSWYRQAKICF